MLIISQNKEKVMRFGISFNALKYAERTDRKGKQTIVRHTICISDGLLEEVAEYEIKERCPYGGCYDDHRAQEDPYTDHYPERHLWSDSHKPGEQANWCRGGNLYPTEECPYFEQYEGQKIEQCYRAMISTFQDGYRSCPMMVNGTCEKCLRDLNEAIQGGEMG